MIVLFIRFELGDEDAEFVTIQENSDGKRLGTSSADRENNVVPQKEHPAFMGRDAVGYAGFEPATPTLSR